MHKSILRVAGACVLAIALCVTLGYAQSGPMTRNPSRSRTRPVTHPVTHPKVNRTMRNMGKLSSVDRSFVNQAADVNLTEIRLGKLARVRGTSHMVRAFGVRMLHDHTALQNRLRMVARREHIALASRPSPASERLIDKLSRLKGTSFDKSYIDNMEKGHMKVVQLYRHEETRGNDPDVMAYARAGEPIIARHLHLAISDVQAIATGTETHSVRGTPKTALPHRKP